VELKEQVHHQLCLVLNNNNNNNLGKFCKRKQTICFFLSAKKKPFSSKIHVYKQYILNNYNFIVIVMEEPVVARNSIQQALVSGALWRQFSFVFVSTNELDVGNNMQQINNGGEVPPGDYNSNRLTQSAGATGNVQKMPAQQPAQPAHGTIGTLLLTSLSLFILLMY
jgi:hypothetical protein